MATGALLCFCVWLCGYAQRQRSGRSDVLLPLKICRQGTQHRPMVLRVAILCCCPRGSAPSGPWKDRTGMCPAELQPLTPNDALVLMSSYPFVWLYSYSFIRTSVFVLLHSYSYHGTPVRVLLYSDRITSKQPKAHVY